MSEAEENRRRYPEIAAWVDAVRKEFPGAWVSYFGPPRPKDAPLPPPRPEELEELAKLPPPEPISLPVSAIRRRSKAGG
jgi:hypothetical protein